MIKVIYITIAVGLMLILAGLVCDDYTNGSKFCIATGLYTLIIAWCAAVIFAIITL